MVQETATAIHTVPTKANERIVALDVLRGFALLGILIMNIQSFSMPEAAYFIPTVYGDLGGLNRWVWIISHVLADQKFMAIFSMLYGAGIVLLTSRIEARGQSARGLHYRRTFWLLIIGLAHAYLLWSGDILVSYAICAAMVFWLRRMRPRNLLIVGLIVFLISPLLMFGTYTMLQSAPPAAVAEVTAEFSPSATEIAAEIAAYRAGWLAQMDARVPASVALQTTSLIFYTLWRAGGLMLIGMALYKWGVFSAKRSARFYNWLMIIGVVLGLPLVIYGVIDNFAHDWEVLHAQFGPGLLFNYFGSVLISLGYVAAIMRMVQANLFGALQQRLAAVGRAALTNYLLHSILATFIFYGHGLGLFGAVERWQQMIVVLLIWLVQLIVSPIWLRHFRFGPFEWLWRSLTYMRLQPLRYPRPRLQTQS